ncbi:group-specific protein [Bacillus sp. ISL-75]|uniref:group-specific protein n=1 Tax=Bacillus sp. ISL-75 TaxID=2819137 RepID=UPI001BED2C03|nr:group-specific protein [Bacillus sp. ISL-75]MBT2728417.1 group-specific protein [Bacillus sp. ISL-75]
MLKITLDEKKIEELFLEELRIRLQKIEKKHTFWDAEELCQQTCMSINNIKEKFFYDPRFPKYKVGGKWYFPAKECEEFLLMWIKEQPRN